LSRYTKAHLQQVLGDRTVFEHWTHDASIIPTRWLEHWPHRFNRDRKRIRENTWWAERMGGDAQKVLRSVKSRIRKQGPLRSADFEHGDQGGGTWWGWKPAKAALEYLWRSGDLAITRRDPRSFQKWYDLRERVLPAVHTSTAKAHVQWACHEALERLGTATPTELAAYFHAVPVAKARQWCDAGLASGALIEVDVERLDTAKSVRCVARPNLAQQAAKAGKSPIFQSRDRLRLLCPFDPIIRDRARLKRLFNMHYRFEAFVPAPKRVYGYYVLPILEGDRLIGRVDLKTDRQRGVLQVNGVWWEAGINPTRIRTRMLRAELESLATFAGVPNVGKSDINSRS
jgi:uncharacterized protein YcaQ